MIKLNAGYKKSPLKLLLTGFKGHYSDSGKKYLIYMTLCQIKNTTYITFYFHTHYMMCFYALVEQLQPTISSGNLWHCHILASMFYKSFFERSAFFLKRKLRSSRCKRKSLQWQKTPCLALSFCSFAL